MLVYALAIACSISRPLILAHYMPWFQAPPLAKTWGWHWTMNHFDPAKGQIASHYRPLLPLYDSSDPDVLECHALLMKLAGIDGAILDWYGLDDVYDYASIHRNSGRFVAALQHAGLRFAVCYEDQTLPNLLRFGKIEPGKELTKGREILSWLKNHWFANKSYVRVDQKPLFLIFGPQYFSPKQWAEIMAPQSLSVQAVMGTHDFATGGFAWPAPQKSEQTSWRELASFYERSRSWPSFVAGAYPRFHDIYSDAGTRPSYAIIPDNNGSTLRKTLKMAFDSKAPVVQLITWNDWGEGTQIEPSKEYGFRDLEIIQKATGSRYRPADLRLPLELFRLRKGKHAQKPALDRVARLLNGGDTSRARGLLASLGPN